MSLTARERLAIRSREEVCGSRLSRSAHHVVNCPPHLPEAGLSTSHENKSEDNCRKDRRYSGDDERSLDQRAEIIDFVSVMGDDDPFTLQSRAADGTTWIRFGIRWARSCQAYDDRPGSRSKRPRQRGDVTFRKYACAAARLRGSDRLLPRGVISGGAAVRTQAGTGVGAFLRRPDGGGRHALLDVLDPVGEQLDADGWPASTSSMAASSRTTDGRSSSTRRFRIDTSTTSRPSTSRPASLFSASAHGCCVAGVRRTRPARWSAWRSIC